MKSVLLLSASARVSWASTMTALRAGEETGGIIYYLTSPFQSRLCKMDGEDQDIDCEEGEIIMVDLVTFAISCGPDDGRCPGAFSVGCDTDTETPTPTTAEATTTNESTNPTTAEATTTTTSSSSDSIWISLFSITASVWIFLFQYDLMIKTWLIRCPEQRNVWIISLLYSPS